MLFAKGIGLYDGQAAYKFFLVIAFVCALVKICITEYTYKEWAIILSLLLMSVVVYRVSGEKGILICMVTVVAMKNVSLKRAFGVGGIVWGIAMGGRLLISLAQIESVQTAVQTKNILGAVLRYFMGYPHPNVLHISYLILTVFIVYCVKETYHWKHLFILAIGNLFLFFYSYSFTGMLIVMMFLILSYFIKKRKVGRIEYNLVRLIFPFCILFSIIFPIILKGKAFEIADKVFNNRIHLAKYFLILQNISLFGNNLAEITTNVITMDNSYIFALVVYGVPVFLLICAGYFVVVEIYIKQKKNTELAIICSFLLAGIVEPFLFNTSFKNLTLLFVGECFFIIMKKKNDGQKEIALIKNMDKKIFISVDILQKTADDIQEIWSVYRKIILTMGMIIAVASGIAVNVFYQIRPEVFAIQNDNLLAYERIRVSITAFSLGYIISVFIIGSAYMVAFKKSKKK